MSLPTEADFALLKLGDGEDPEGFDLLCGITDVTVNKSAATSDRYVRDCTKPGEVPFRKTKVNGRSLDISGAGLSNVANIATLDDILGVVKNWKVELYEDDGTDAGNLLGTYSLAARLTADNLSTPREGDASGDISLASQGAWTYTAA